MPTTTILGIETSCDETSISIVDDGRKVRSNVVASQAKLHKRFGGVVPEIASRQHTVTVEPCLREALEKADCSLDDIDGIAVTSRPGLIGSLVVGIAAAKAISWSLGIPVVPVDHLAAHCYSVMLLDDAPEYPYLCLLVSGGHTLLYLVHSPLERQVLGSTIDDASGEAFDKVAKMLGLGYPGGPIIGRLAADGDPDAYDLPRPLIHEESFDFSFSGLKTSARRTIEVEGSNLRLHDFAASVEQAIVEVLLVKTMRAADEFGVRHVGIAGGVACNRRLQALAREAFAEQGVNVAIPPPLLCTDNGGMIAGLGFHLYEAGDFADFALDGVSSGAIRRQSRERRAS